jgi:hypothetical protein
MNKDSEAVRVIRRGRDALVPVVRPLSEISGPIEPLSNYCVFDDRLTKKTMFVKAIITQCIARAPVYICCLLDNVRHDVEHDEVAGKWKIKSTGDIVHSVDVMFRASVVITDASCVKGLLVVLPHKVVEYLTKETAEKVYERVYRDMFSITQESKEFNKTLEKIECVFEISVLKDWHANDKEYAWVKAIYV